MMNEGELAKEILSLMVQGKKEEIKKLYPQMIENQPWFEGML